MLELDPADAGMQKAVKRLEPIVEERREKMKDEMMGAQLRISAPSKVYSARTSTCSDRASHSAILG